MANSHSMDDLCCKENRVTWRTPCASGYVASQWEWYKGAFCIVHLPGLMESSLLQVQEHHVLHIHGLREDACRSDGLQPVLLRYDLSLS